jgi:hypothetical protein
MSRDIPFYRFSYLQFTKARAVESLSIKNLRTKEICPLSECAVDRSLSWYSEEVQVSHYLQGGTGGAGLISSLHSQPWCYVKKSSLAHFDGYVDNLNFKEVQVESNEQYAERILEPVYLLEAKHRLPLDAESLARSRVECACGRTHYRMPVPGFDVVAPPGAVTAFFVVSELADSYLYVDEPTLKVFKKLKLVQGKCTPIGVIRQK